MFNDSRTSRSTGRTSVRVASAAAVLALLLAASAPAQSPPPCGTVYPSALGSQFPDYSSSAGDVWAGDHYVYALTLYGFTRTSIANPDAPAGSQLAQVGWDRSVQGGGGGHVVIDCDCHNGGTTMGVAEAPNGDSRLISDWLPTGSNTPYQAAQGVGGRFEFGQQVDASQAATNGVRLAAIYLPDSGKYFGFTPSGTGYVQSEDLTTLTGASGQTCTPSLSNCRTVPSQFLPATTTSLRWYALLWAGKAVVDPNDPSRTRYLLVGASGSQLHVASIDHLTGVPTEIGVGTVTGTPSQMEIAAVKGGVYIFSAEPTGLQVYEVRPDNSIVMVQQPSAFAGTSLARVTVRGAPGSLTPLVFTARASFSFIDIYDTNWLIPGSVLGGTPRLGYSVPHGGTLVAGLPLGAAGFGAKVTKVGSVINAYIFRVVATQPQYSVASTKVDVSCIAADPTAPAAASFAMTNLSAAQRTAPENAKNYFGDRWRIQDTTSTGIPLNQVEWDLVAPDAFVPPAGGTFSPDSPTWAMLTTGTVQANLEILDGGIPPGQGVGIVWPCDPSTVGIPGLDPNTGSGCHASLGGSPPSIFNIKLRAQNPNPGPSIAAQSRTVLAPTVFVNGQTGSAANVSVLTGAGVLDSRGSPATQGNAAEATFTWTFNCSPGCGGQSGPGLTLFNNVPATASSYSLDVTYVDGYRAALVSGSIAQTDIVPAFTVTTPSVLPNAQVTLRNQMQIGAATVDSVTYVINSIPSPLTGTLAPSFNVVNGTASVTAPGTVNPYTITLTYNYAVGSNHLISPITPVQPFSVASWAPAPVLRVFFDAAATNLVPCAFGGCDLILNTTYYVVDDETVPDGLTHPGATFTYFNPSPVINVFSPSNVTLPSTAPTRQGTLAFTPTSVCPSGCHVDISVSGQNCALGCTLTQGVAVRSSALPLSVSISGPTSGTTNTPVTFTANASGGTPSYSYEWDCQYVSLGPNYHPGSFSQSCTFPSASLWTVAVRLTDGGGNRAVGLTTINVGGSGAGQLSVAINGPSTAVRNTPVTFTAQASGGSGSYTYSWRAGEGPFELPTSTGANPSFSHTYTAAAVYGVVCIVTDSLNAAAQANKDITITAPSGPPSPLSTYTVTGASFNASTGNYDAEAGATVTFTAQEAQVNVAGANGYTWTFPGSVVQHSQEVTFVFSSTGSATVTLQVTGDGVNRAGTVSSFKPFNITAPSFQAFLVPAAEHRPVVGSGGQKYFRTDVTVANPGSLPLTISPAYLDSLAVVTPVFDISSQVTYDPAKLVTVPPNGLWTQTDVVQYLAGDISTLGTLILKYSGGNATPLVTARVYAASAADPLGPSAGTALTVLKATRDGEIVQQSAQVTVDKNLPGLRSDAFYYFRLTVATPSVIGGFFRLSAVDQDGNPVLMKDPSDNFSLSTFVDIALGPYQAWDWSGDDLGLNDPVKRYVVKVTRTPGKPVTGGKLLVFARLNDRLTGDPSLITPDSPLAVLDPCTGGQSCVNYVVPGASRFPTPGGAHWKTGLTIYNPSLQTRGLYLTYTYSPPSLQPPENVASNFIQIGAGKLLTYDDVVKQLFATAANHLADETGSGTAGVLRVQHFQDNETSTSPPIIGARNYDDEVTGTVGSQLAVYTRALSLGPGEPPLMLAGLRQDDPSNATPRYLSTVNVFAYDDTPTVVRLTAIKADGTVLGHHDLALNQAGSVGHFQPRYLSASDPTNGSLNGAQGAPVTVRIDVLSGGRVGAYGLVEDTATHDPTYIQAGQPN